MNTNNETLINTHYRGHETSKDNFGLWEIYRCGQLVCTRPTKESALKWIEQRADEIEMSFHDRRRSRL